MARSLWKGPFVDHSLISEEAPKYLKKMEQKKVRVWSRRSYILPQFVGKYFEIHNGKGFISIEIQEEMIGHKFGEFAMTRRRAVHKKKDKRKN